MSLLHEFSDVEISRRNRARYLKLGYDVPDPGMNESIMFRVRTEHLPNNTLLRVETICDNCGKITLNSMSDYLHRNKNGKTYCNACAHALFNSGENNNKWNPKLTDEERKERRSKTEYISFTKKVLARDNYTCQCCGNKAAHKKELVVHHLDGYDWCEEKRLDVTNAVTLCKPCHKNFHDRYGRGHNTKDQYNEWLGRVVQHLTDYNGELPPAREIICLETKEIYPSSHIAARENHTQSSRIQKCCMMYENVKYGMATKSVKGKHYLYLDVYQKMTEDDIAKYLEWCKTTSFHTSDNRHTHCRRVVCINDLLVFRAIQDAADYYGTGTGGITECCQGKLTHYGINKKTNELLYWMYYEEYVDKYGNKELIYHNKD